MQSLLYKCPNCHKSIEVEEALIGDIVTCPNPDCRQPFRVQVPEARPEERGARDIGEPGEETLHLRAGRSGDESVVHEAHPAMFRKHPIKFLALAVIIILSGIGFLSAAVFGNGLTLNNYQILQLNSLFWAGGAVFLVSSFYMLGWWLKIANTTLTITSKRTILRKGILAKETTEVQHDDVRNLQIDQNAFERIMGVGDIAVSSSGQSGLEIYVEAIPRANEVASMIRDMQ